MRPCVGAVILAAGQSRRFGTGEATKVVAPFRGVPLVRAVAISALRSHAAVVTVVSGHAHDKVSTALSGLDVEIVRNADFASGMASSLQCGLATLPNNVDGVLVLLADMPSVQMDTLDCLIARFGRRASMIDAVVPIHDGRRGNPVLIGRRLFASIQALKGDEGARGVLLRPDLAIERCVVDDPAVLIDIDTASDLVAADRPACAKSSVWK